MGTLLFYYGFKTKNSILMGLAFPIGVIFDIVIVACIAKATGKL